MSLVRRVIVLVVAVLAVAVAAFLLLGTAGARRGEAARVARVATAVRVASVPADHAVRRPLLPPAQVAPRDVPERPQTCDVSVPARSVARKASPSTACGISACSEFIDAVVPSDVSPPPTLVLGSSCGATPTTRLAARRPRR